MGEVTRVIVYVMPTRFFPKIVWTMNEYKDNEYGATHGDFLCHFIPG